MIIWLNGTFGVGKTTTGSILAGLDPRLRTVDPESVGSLLVRALPDHDVRDFQDFEAWRRLTPIVIDEIARTTGQHLVAVQSVLSSDYWSELQVGLARLGHRVFHVLLEADERVVRERIEADVVETSARQWRLDHLPTCAAARPWMLARTDLRVDTTHRTPADAASVIHEAVRELLGEG